MALGTVRKQRGKWGRSLASSSHALSEFLLSGLCLQRTNLGSAELRSRPRKAEATPEVTPDGSHVCVCV